jgi:hypothetical protein
MYLFSHIFYVIYRKLYVMHIVIGIVIGYTSLMGRKVRVCGDVCYCKAWKPPWALHGVISGWHRSRQTINYQRQEARAEATRKWEERWHASPRTSSAYCTACIRPPDGKLHPILRIQQKGWVEKPFSPNEKAPPTQQKQREQPRRRSSDSS